MPDPEDRRLSELLTVEQQREIAAGRIVIEVWSDGSYCAHNYGGRLVHGATPRLAVEALNR